MKNSLIAKIRQDQNGSVFLGLVMIMIIFAALGAAMISMTTTSSFSRVWTGSVSRAYYLAESGFRYAETEYKNTSDTDNDGEKRDDRNQKLINWHSPGPPGTPVLFSFSNNEDKFELKIYPYFLVTAISHTAGTTSLQTKFPGEQPANFPIQASTSGALKIGTDAKYSYTNYSYNSGTKIHTFTLSAGLDKNVSDNMDVYLIVNTPTNQNIVQDGSITLQDASLLPDKNGVFEIDGGNGTVYAYKYKDSATHTLHGIFDAYDPGQSITPVSVQPSDDIVINPFVELHSIGIVDYGADVETRREIVYNVPLTTEDKKRDVFTDTFEDKSNWEDSTLGSHDIDDSTGDSALKVAGTDTVGASDQGSLIKLKWSQTNVNLGVAQQEAGDFLSYDTQVKTGFTPAVPDYYMPGISFRVRDDGNYGLSFLRGSKSVADGIPDDLVPLSDSPMVVLWQQTSLGMDWLAYKHLSGEVEYFSDDVESGLNGWTAVNGCPAVPNPPCVSFGNDCDACPTCSGLWHISTRRPYSSSNSWYYGREATGDYDTGTRNCGSIVSPNIDLTAATSAFLSFWSWYKTEFDPANPGWVDTYDYKFVDIYDGTSWTEPKYQIVTLEGTIGSWQKIKIDLSDYIGKTIQVRFRFDTRDAAYNSATDEVEGWYIDDVEVTAAFPINEATLMVRLIEGAALKFTTTGTGNTTPIKDGDLVIQAGTGERGTVIGEPIMESGSWAGGNAVGTIILNNVSGTFQNGFNLEVGGSIFARATSDSRPRDNYIRAYYGDPSGFGTPSSQYLDYDKHGYPRGDITRWPPDDVADWAAANDYYTLIQWDQVRALGEVPAGLVIDTLARVSSLDEPNAVIRSNALTTTTATFADAEIGLHTFGTGSYSLNVYFGDFALQTKALSKARFLTPVQE